MTIASVGRLFNGPQVGQGHGAPGSEGFEFLPELQWDTWLALGSKPVWITPTFPDIALNSGGDNIIGNVNAAWFNGNPADPALEEDGSVLIGQFSFDDLSGMYFAAQIQVIQADGTEVLHSLESFYGNIPSPGALAAFGLAGMVSRRHRRA